MSKWDPFNSSTSRAVFVSIVLIFFIGAVGYISQLAIGGYFQKSDLIPRVLVTFIIFVTTVVMVSMTSYLLRRLEDSGSLSPHQREISYRFTQMTTYSVLSLVVVLYVWNVDLSDILIGAGALGIILGLATRKILSSIVSGIIIMSTNMFRVGDWIKYSEKFGRIEKITFFHIQIRSPQGEEHIIPNDKITGTEITNISNNRYRKDLLISVDYDSDIDEVVSVCDDVLNRLSDEEDNYINGYQSTSVKEFDDSSIVISIKIWMEAPTPSVINEAQTRALSEIKNRFQQEGINIPYPQRTISNRESGGKHMSE